MQSPVCVREVCAMCLSSASGLMNGVKETKQYAFRYIQCI